MHPSRFDASMEIARITVIVFGTMARMTRNRTVAIVSAAISEI